MSVVVSAKVPKELKERARKYGIVIGELVRRALESEVTRLEEERLRNELIQISRKLKGKVTDQDFVKAVRESREER